MTYQPITAKFEEGHIVLPPDVDVDWPSGITVQVVPVEEEIPTLYEMLKDWDGIATDLPSDLAANIDHYVHGHPKK
jgi:hypothetical protein